MILNRKIDNKIGIRINPDYDVKKIHHKNPDILLYLDVILSIITFFSGSEYRCLGNILCLINIFSFLCSPEPRSGDNILVQMTVDK